MTGASTSSKRCLTGRVGAFVSMTKDAGSPEKKWASLRVQLLAAKLLLVSFARPFHPNDDVPGPVSYTHLTLPTNRDV